MAVVVVFGAVVVDLTVVGPAVTVVVFAAVVVSAAAVVVSFGLVVVCVVVESFSGAVVDVFSGVEFVSAAVVVVVRSPVVGLKDVGVDIVGFVVVMVAVAKSVDV